MRLTPRGGADQVEGLTGAGELRVRVRAGPAGGEANRALLALLADALGVGRSSVAIERGATSRSKRLVVHDVSAGDLRLRWPGIAVEDLR